MKTNWESGQWEFELCLKMYVYATRSCDKTQNKKYSKINTMLSEFFHEELIEKVREHLVLKEVV